MSKETYPIRREELDSHLSKVNGKLKSLKRTPTDRVSYFELVKNIGGDEQIMAKEVQESITIMRDSFSLFYFMHGVLEDKLKDMPQSNSEKIKFSNTYAMYAASSFAGNQSQLLLEGESPLKLPESERELCNTTLTKDNALNNTLVQLYGIVNLGKRSKLIKKGIDVVRASTSFYKALEEQMLEKKHDLNRDLVALIENDSFNILETFTLTGFTASHDHTPTQKVTVFEPVQPEEVAGNTRAKKEMFRDIDRMALFDLIEKKNPVVKVGGLSSSVVYVGLPGTGKSMLFRAGFTKLNKWCEALSDYWQSHNFPGLSWKQIAIDTTVKDEYYGKTGKLTQAKFDEAQRTDGIYIVTADDIDLIVSGRQSEGGGANNDILNVMMQHMNSITSVFNGNNQFWAATNDPTAIDAALLQRFAAQYTVDGPEKWYDFANILSNKLRLWMDDDSGSSIIKVAKSISYVPYEKRSDNSTNSNSSPSSLTSKVSFEDIGHLMEEEKQKNPRFTGRAVHAVSEAIGKRINDYDIPAEWYEKPSLYFEKPFAERVNILKELCQPVTGEIIMDEIKRYADLQRTYTEEKFNADVQKALHNQKVHAEMVRIIGDEK